MKTTETTKHAPMIGISAEADFPTNRWTFEMTGDYKVSAGRYAIVREDEYKRLQEVNAELLAALRQIVDVFDNHRAGDWLGAMEVADEAIANATGEEE